MQQNVFELFIYSSKSTIGVTKFKLLKKYKKKLVFGKL